MARYRSVGWSRENCGARQLHQKKTQQVRQTEWRVKHDLRMQPIDKDEIVWPQHCDIMVNDNYKIIYLRLYKAGSTSGVGAFTMLPPTIESALFFCLVGTDAPRLSAGDPVFIACRTEGAPRHEMSHYLAVIDLTLL